MYPVTLNVTNQTGLSSQTTFHAVAVFNPAVGAGSEQGGGFVPSPAGSFTANPSLGGTGTITTLIASYDATTAAITTNSTFMLSYAAASLAFSSTTTTGVKWLAMSGNKSWMKAEASSRSVASAKPHMRWLLSSTPPHRERTGCV